MKHIATILVIAACMAQAAVARTHGESGTWSFVIDNDVIVGTDQRYTNGVRIGWLAPAAERADSGGQGLSVRLRDVLEPLPFVGAEGHRHSAALSVTQVMVTPDDIEATQLLPNQAPYYGHLAVGLALYAWNESGYHALGVSAGVVGPDSGAAATQREIHRLLGSKQPKGWDNQVGRRTTADVSYLRGYRVSRQAWSNGLRSDLTANFGVTLGSPETSAAIGGVWRWGRNLPETFNVYFADGGGEAALLSLGEQPTKAGWFVYGGAVGTVLAYSTLERATRKTHNFSRRDVLGTALIGVTAYRGNWQVGLSLQADTSPVYEDKRPIGYGSLYVAWTP